jgi:hypothetical protein
LLESGTKLEPHKVGLTTYSTKLGVITGVALKKDGGSILLEILVEKINPTKEIVQLWDMYQIGRTRKRTPGLVLN